MPRIVRRTSTKVINGVVSPKNREDATDPRPYAIIREPAGRGFRHVVSACQLEQFIRLIPEADQLLQGVERIVLSGGSEKVYGWHRDLWRRKVATIELCAWTKDIWAPMSVRYFRQHQPYLEASGSRTPWRKLPFSADSQWRRAGLSVFFTSSCTSWGTIRTGSGGVAVE